MAKIYLVIGGTGGIGSALIDQILASHERPTSCHSKQRDEAIIFATYHRQVPIQRAKNLYWLKMDVGSEDSIKSAVEHIKTITPSLNVVINTVGMLQSPEHGPEKSIRQFETDFFLHNIVINTLPSLLIAKHIKPLLKAAERSSKTPSDSNPNTTIYATISARVGSIGDNQIGGWYSYRMSKAALNMGMKTLAIEWARTLHQVCVVVLQPGTVDTDLSKPFQSNVPKGGLFTAAHSAKKLLEVLNTLTAAQSGSFVDWAGKEVPW